MKENITAPKLPIAERTVDSYALPSRSNRCAGSRQSAISPSGAPKKAAGIKLTKVCATEVAIMIDATRIRIVSEGRNAVKQCSSAAIIGAIVRRIKAALFGCKPGTSPVNVPKSTPSIEKPKNNSNGKNVSIIFESWNILNKWIKI